MDREVATYLTPYSWAVEIFGLESGSKDRYISASELPSDRRGMMSLVCVCA